MVGNGQVQQHRRQPRSYNAHQGTAVFTSPGQYAAARERGRAMAAEAMLLDTEKRKEMEAEYGVTNCRIQYPEAYGLKTMPRIVLP